MHAEQFHVLQLFGEDLKTADGDGVLSFNEFLEAVNVKPAQTAAPGKRSNRKAGS
jgi:hypothetical protein